MDKYCQDAMNNTARTPCNHTGRLGSHSHRNIRHERNNASTI